MAKPQNPAIRTFILEHVEAHPQHVVRMAHEHFDLSRTAINKYMDRLIAEGLIDAEGNTKSRRYTLKNIANHTAKLRLTTQLSEDAVWQSEIKPHMHNAPKNVVDICHYGFTEMFNNAIDHSTSWEATVSYEQNYRGITMRIADGGIGIFEKIKRHFKLPDTHTALLELAKGKLTSYPQAHAGEGIFFTSRMFDAFSIRSGDQFYMRERRDHGEWAIHTSEDVEYYKGTLVSMRISTQATWTTREIFQQYQGTHGGFRKTHIPIKLALYEGEQLVSRSQAKRILARVEVFSEMMLDFSEIETIGQAFADEMFRVFANNHPEIKIVVMNTNPDIDRMIAYVKAA
jgi:anti-sigma regulatory factor (Ser/Thr protein kinase)/biotin operon repressor